MGCVCSIHITYRLGNDDRSDYDMNCDPKHTAQHTHPCTHNTRTHIHTAPKANTPTYKNIQTHSHTPYLAHTHTHTHTHTGNALNTITHIAHLTYSTHTPSHTHTNTCIPQTTSTQNIHTTQ